MEVSQAKLDLTQARDSLVKVRVATHSADPRVVAVDIDAGLKTASADFAAGEKAMQERNYRRIGLGFSLVAIMLALVGLRLYIIQIERKA